jgi:hypothetical protein
MSKTKTKTGGDGLKLPHTKKNEEERLRGLTQYIADREKFIPPRYFNVLKSKEDFSVAPAGSVILYVTFTYTKKEKTPLRVVVVVPPELTEFELIRALIMEIKGDRDLWYIDACPGGATSPWPYLKATGSRFSFANKQLLPEGSTDWDEILFYEHVLATIGPPPPI